MSLLKVKVTPKSESKLYSYNKYKSMHQYKILNYYFIIIKILSILLPI